MRRQQPLSLDKKTRNELYIRNNLSTRIEYHGFFKGIGIWILVSILHAASFSVQIFLRTRIGLRSYTVLTVPFAYVWVRFFLLGDFEFEALPGDYSFFSKDNYNETSVNLDEKLQGFYGILYYFKQFFFNFGHMGQAMQPIPKGGSNFIFLYSFFIVILGYFNLLYVFIRGGVHSLSRGESVFFFWAYNQKSSRAKRLINVIVEPLLIVLLGLGFIYFTPETGFGFFLILSAIAFFYRERVEYYRILEEEEDIGMGRS